MLKPVCGDSKQHKIANFHTHLYKIDKEVVRKSAVNFSGFRYSGWTHPVNST